MPRYYGGYNDSLAQYSDTTFDPLTGRLNGGQLVMQVLNQLQALKEKKKQDKMSDEDRQWELLKREMDKQAAELEMSQRKQAAQDYISPGKKMSMEAFLRGIEEARDQKNALARIEAEKNANIAIAKTRAGQTGVDQERLDAVDARRTAAADAKERRKRYSDLVTQQRAIEKQMASTKLAMAKASASKDTNSFAALSQTHQQLELQKNIIDESLQTIADELTGGPEKVAETKSIGGTTYYKWSDGKWYPSKEVSQTKK